MAERQSLAGRAPGDGAGELFGGHIARRGGGQAQSGRHLLAEQRMAERQQHQVQRFLVHFEILMTFAEPVVDSQPLKINLGARRGGGWMGA